MKSRPLVWIGLAVALLAVATGNGASMLRALERGLAWGGGRDIAHGVIG